MQNLRQAMRDHTIWRSDSCRVLYARWPEGGITRAILPLHPPELVAQEIEAFASVRATVVGVTERA